jgi:hypothetical protein
VTGVAEQGDDQDAKLIDSLYEGGEDPSGLHMVRSLVARVRAEQSGVEPPQAISARLLQAAEEHAPRRAAVPVEAPSGFWARIRAWMAPFAAHPGVMAAATLVVVAGAALYLQQGGRTAEPTRSQEPARVAERQEAAPELAPQTPTPAAVTVPDQPVAPEPLADKKGEEKKVSRPTRKVAPPAKPETVTTADDGETESAKRDQAPARVTVEGTVRGNVGGEDADSQQAAPPPPPPPPSAKTTTESRKPEKVAPATAQDLMQQARAAAKKGDCKLVERLGVRVKSLDASYYAKTFSTDAAIKGCQK